MKPRALVLLLSSLAAAAFISPWISQSAFAQNNNDQFFAGMVVDASAEQITVSRVLQGKTETRAFRITPETKVEGNLTVNARVTVGYDGDRATLVIVRDEAKEKSK